jgi:hypothetical protein
LKPANASGYEVYTACAGAIMKLLFTSALLSLALPSAEPILRESSGLEVLSLEVKKGSVLQTNPRFWSYNQNFGSKTA